MGRMQQTVLHSLQVADARLLGEGIEAWIYELSPDRVVRIYKRAAPGLRTQLAGLQAFYDSLAVTNVGFAVPKLLSIGEVDDVLYTIDRQLKGEQLGRVLAGLTPGQAQPLLQAYLALADDISKLHRPFSYFGEILQENPLRCASWPEFITQKTTASYLAAKAQLDHDAPGLPAVISYIKNKVGEVAADAPPLLVHGDFNAMNVLADHGTLQALVDFGSLTLAGDPRMDLASGVIGFLEAEDGMRKEDGDFIMRQLTQKHGTEVRDIIHLYRMYYAVVFAASCKESDPRTYAWALRTFKEHLADSYQY